MTDKRCLGPDIWPEISDQVKKTENMMRTVWVEEAHCQQKASGTRTPLLSPSNKVAKHMSPLISYYVTIGLLNCHRFWIQS